MKRVLITGGEGQLARALVAAAPKSVDWWSPKHAVLDIAEPVTLEEKINWFRPGIVINAAAYTAVDRAETERDKADLVNHRAVAELGRICAAQGIRVLHVSTDYVFDGESQRPYRPTDETRPRNVYGQSKAAGEEALMASGAEYNIVRSSWIYAPWGHNFLVSMAARIGRGERLRIVDDQVGAPTSAPELAAALWGMEKAWPEPGIWHWSNLGQASWYDFAREIAQQLHAAGRIEKPAEIDRVSSDEYGAPAERPRYTVLDCGQTLELLGEDAGDWREALGRAIKRLP